MRRSAGQRRIVNSELSVDAPAAHVRVDLANRSGADSADWPGRGVRWRAVRLTQRPLADGPGVEFLRLERVVGRLRWYDGAGGGDAGWWLEREAGDAEALWQCPASTPDLDGARVAHEAAARWFADWILTHPAGRGHESPRD